MKEKPTVIPHDNMSEYEDPAQYDRENDAYEDDLPFLSEWAHKQGGTLVDLACGTGRTAIALAKTGFDVIGIDLHTGMLNRARAKADQEQLPIRWAQQDCSKLSLGQEFRMLFMVGNAFQHFLTNEEQNRLLSSVHRHLEADGVFIFGTRFPSLDELLQPETEQFWHSYEDKAGFIVDVSTISRYDAVRQVQSYSTIRKFKQDGMLITESETNIDLRYVFPQEMSRLLHQNGFVIHELYGSWSKEPLSSQSHSMIYVCSKSN